MRAKLPAGVRMLAADVEFGKGINAAEYQAGPAVS